MGQRKRLPPRARGALAAAISLLASMVAFWSAPSGARSAEPAIIRMAPLPGNPQLGADVGCVRIRGAGVPLFRETFTVLGFLAGPNGIPEDGGGDDVPLGPVPASWSFTLLQHHARYDVQDPSEVGEIHPALGLFTAGIGPATGFGKVTARTEGGLEVEAPIFILPPDFVANPPPRIHHLACEERGASVRLEWLPGGEYLRQTVYRDGTSIAVLSGDATSLDDAGAPPGIREYEVVGTARDAARDRELDSDPTRCVLAVRRPATAHLLWSPVEQARGRTDSAAAIREALLQNGEEVHEVREITGVNLRDFRAVWAIFGTFPDEHYLWLSEAVQLADYLTQDRGKLYIEGADVWGFVPRNAFHGVDGIFDCHPDDPLCIGVDGGRADLFTLRGVNGGNGLDLSDFGPLPYTGENQFIDRLLPGPPGSAVVWTNPDAGYAAGVAYRGPDRRVIHCSFEFGGMGADQKEVMRRYLEFLGAATTDLRFVRGDADLNGEIDISDAISTLGFLFLGTSLPDCPDARDTNDDGDVDITDGIGILGFLFLGSAAPRPPHPACGLDPTEDASVCLEPPDC